MTYRNGEIPLNDLTLTSIGVRLRADAAASIERMAPAFRAGVGHPLRASDGYRAKTGAFGQIATFESRYTSLTSLGVSDRRGPWTRTSHPSLGARWWWRRPSAAAAAVPGTSNHGWAVACDFASGINSLGSAAHQWMVRNAGTYGWVWPAWAQRRPTLEPWHWEYHPDLDQHRGSGGGAAPAPTSPVPDLPAHIQEALMAGPIRMRLGTSVRVVALDGTDVPVPNTEYDGIIAQAFDVPLVQVVQREADVIRDFCSRVRDQRNTEIAAKVGAR